MALCTAALILWPTPAHAQRRGHRVGGAGGGAVVVAPRVYLGFGYYDPFWWGSWGPGWGGPGWPPPFGPAFMGGPVGSARLLVTPRDTEVYVDGYLAGSVDDFDGFFQRLDIAAGEHEITLYLDGYETITERVLFRPGATLEIRHQMQKLAPGASSGQRPVAATPPPQPEDPNNMPPPERGPWRGGRPPFRNGPPPEQAGGFGTLAVRVQPADATLLVDGEEWAAPEGDGPVLIELPDGPHDVEVRKDGLPSYRRTVQVRAGRTLPLNVSLSR